jgi:drug/metabolite transporter, DME family
MLLLGELSALGGALTWALSSVLLSRISRKLHVLAIGAVRCLSSTVFFLLLVPFSGGWHILSGVDLRAIAALVTSVVIVLGVGDTIFLLSARRIGMVRAMPISMTYPLFTVVLAAIFLHEDVTLLVGLGALLILVGVYLLSSGSRAAPAAPAAKANVPGILLALGAAVLWAVGTIVLAPVSQTISPVAANIIRQPAAALMFLVFMPKPQSYREIKKLSRRELLTLIAAGVIASGFGAQFYLLSLRYAGASISAVLGATSPVFSTPLSIILLGEKASFRVVIGSLLIIAGVWLVILG